MLYRFRQVLRIYTIYRVLVRHGLDEIIPPSPLSKTLRFVLYLTPAYWRRDCIHPRAYRIREALEELGPIFVKFGQILSTRRDLLPEDIADELAKLQDRVKPFPANLALKILAQTYRRPLTEVFAEFNPEPIAAASVAQVHNARLHDGREVVVKILRPGIAPVIRKDLDVMYLLAGLAQRYWREGRRLHPREVVGEFEKNLYDELDLLREAGNSSMLRRNFEDSDMLYVPEVMWSYSHPNVLVMERIGGLAVSDVETLKAHGVNLKRLADIGVEIFFTQVFRDNFFHADMHPGNIFVDASNPEYPSYIAVDFGIMGALSPADQHYLAENFLAFFRRDYRRVAELHVHSEWVPADTRVEEFEGAIRCVCEPIFNRPIKEISFGFLLLRLFQTARRFNMEVQPQLVLLQKTLLNIEGLGRQLYPDLDLWQTAKPFLERWMNERIGFRAFVDGLRREAPHWAQTLPKLPGMLEDALEQQRQQKSANKRLLLEMSALRRELRAHQRQRNDSLFGATLLLSGAIILALETIAVLNMPVLGMVAGGAGLVLLLSSWLR
jgi:ubiquinone biosynthesis protein